MTLIKSLLLGSAAGIVAVASAQAADLPTRKAAPAAQYVRICTVGGITGFVLPGSDTCLKISGYITAQIEAGNLKKQWLWAGDALGGPGHLDQTVIAPGTPTKMRDGYGYTTRANLTMDLASNTSMGPLIGHFEFQFNHGEGFDNTGQGGSDGGLNRAYVSWAGITAGKANSFFAFFGGGENWPNIFSPDRQGFNQPDLLAYTASFGGGFSATLSLEDGAGSGGGWGTRPDATGNLVYTGSRIPDIVGSLDVAQGWGGAHLAGVYHRVDVFDIGGSPELKKSGWAIDGGVKFNLPSFGPGDNVAIQAQYSKNAVQYSGIPDGMWGEEGQVNGNGMVMPVADAYWNGVGWASPTAWGVTVLMEHAFTPQFYIHPEVSYTQLHWSNTLGQLSSNSRSWIVGADLGWSPVTNLNFDLDLMYQNTHQSMPLAYTHVVPVAWPSTSSGFAGRLRITRSF